jgi:hypothetical protein
MGRVRVTNDYILKREREKEHRESGKSQQDSQKVSEKLEGNAKKK